MILIRARLKRCCTLSLFYLLPSLGRSLDQELVSTIGTCRLATSRYLLSLAEAWTMYVRGAPLLDVWTFRSGDGAEGLTLGVATKREESPLRIRATLEEQDPNAVSEDHVNLFIQNHRRWTGLYQVHCPGI